MTNPIAILLGAGASQAYNVPTMATFYEAFRAHLQRKHPSHFALLELFEKSGRHPQADLETLLSDLQLAMSAPYSLGLLGASVGQDVLRTEEVAELRGLLDAFIVDTCERFDRSRSATDLKTLLDLREFGPLWIFSTNYDRVVEQACEQAEVEYSDGFRAAVGNPVADYTGTFDSAINIVKLHGSVNWYRDNPGGALHRLDRGYSLPTKDFALVRSGQSLVPLMIIPTLEKQVLDRPYPHLALRFTDIIRDTKVLIIIGNSLRDRHVLAYIQDRMPRLQVLLVGPHASTSVSRVGLPNAHTLDVGTHELLSTSGHSLLTLSRDLQSVESATDVGSAVQRFVAQVSLNTETDQMMQSNPELALLDRDLGSTSVAQRARAAAELGRFAHPVVVRRLETVLKNDSSDAVRAAAVGSLLGLGTNVACQTAMLGLKDVSTAVQLEAVAGLLTKLPNLDIETGLKSSRATLAPVSNRILDEHFRKVLSTDV